jgi:hypothetical protein
MALVQLKLNAVPKGTFLGWLESKGKVGAQNKIPRLCNTRTFLEQILELHVTRLSR